MRLSKRIRVLKRRRIKLDSEQEIMVNRLVMGGISCILTLAIGASNLIALAFFSYLTCNALLLVKKLRNIFPRWLRIVSGNALDCSMAFAVMQIDPQGMAIFYPILLWMVLGNGFRFGVKYMFIASLAATVSFGSIVMTTPYWADNQALGYSLLIALVAIPLYCSTLVKKLSLAKEQAEVANEAKSYFLASVSHELRTPLNAIIAYGNHLKNTRLVPSQKQMVEASVLAGEHLLHLFNQLIQISKTDVSPVAKESKPFKPSELLAGVRDIMEVRASAKGLFLRVQAEAMSDEIKHGPAETIRNILMNLISNAIKFTEAGGVSVTMRVTKVADKEHLQFEVSDTGIGIAEEAQAKIFEAFQQADNSISGRFGGTGLGLAICNHFVESMSGTIKLSSTVGHGSRFSVSLPLNSAEAESEETENDAQQQNVACLIAFGEFEGSVISDAQYADDFDILHIQCANQTEFEAAVENFQLEQFEVALIDQRLVANCDSDHSVWNVFAHHMIAPVLVEHDSSFDFEDISLRAAFASVIPAGADFDEMRSAIRIGCSFARATDDEIEDEIDGAKSEPKSILVADDNRTNRNIMSTVLEAAGHHVTMVTDGDETIDALEEGQFDILLLDVNMPRLNGIDTCKMWRQIEGPRARLPIIGVTADATQDTRMECINAGMDMRITKPIDAKHLIKVIDEKCADKAYSAKSDSTGNDPLSKVVSLSSPTPTSGVDQNSAIDMEQIDYLLSIGDHNFLGSMVQGFMDDTGESLPLFVKSIDDADIEAFRFCAHAFKSSANNIGAKKLAILCGELEFITQEEFESSGAQYIEKVQRELENARQGLQEIAAKQGPKEQLG